jgi:membrane protease YdiL (CAAX protease family)
MFMRLLLLILAIVLPSVGAFLYFVLLRESASANDAYAIVKFSLVIVAIVGWRLSGLSIKKVFSGTKRDTLIGVLIGAFITAILILTYVLLYDFVLPFHEIIRVKATSLFPLNLYIPLMIVFSVFHSLFEEWYWRGFVSSQLDRYIAPMFALIVGALAFTAHHVIILSQLFPGALMIFFSLGVFAAGVVWIVLFRKTGNLLASWVSHIFADLAIFFIGYLII